MAFMGKQAGGVAYSLRIFQAILRNKEKRYGPTLCSLRLTNIFNLGQGCAYPLASLHQRIRQH